MKRVLALLLAMCFVSFTASAAKKPYIPSRVAKRPSVKKGRSKKGGFAKGHSIKRKGAKPAKHARR